MRLGFFSRNRARSSVLRLHCSLRAGGAAEGAVQIEAVSELGISGWVLFGGDGKNEAGRWGKMYEQEQEEGWLLRTK